MISFLLFLPTESTSWRGTQRYSALEEHGFPVPNAVDCNRHCVIMSLVPGYPLVQVKQLENPEIVFNTIIGLVVRLTEHGLIHCDFNEFNIMIDDDEKTTMIDFPQMVSVSHRNAQMYFDRDVECVFKFFSKRSEKLLWILNHYHSELEVIFYIDLQIYGYRMALWAEHLGLVEECFNQPES